MQVKNLGFQYLNIFCITKFSSLSISYTIVAINHIIKNQLYLMFFKMMKEIMTFTDQEILLEAIKTHGKDFKTIQSIEFRKLSIKQIKNAYYKLAREENLSQFQKVQSKVENDAESQLLSFTGSYSIFNIQ